jgi:hypothetical protein
MQQQRLLDELNGSFVANLHHLGEGFMPLTEVRVLFPSGEKDIVISTHVRKSNILFVAERGTGQPERSGFKEAKGHPQRIKKPLGARVYMPPYTVEGKMHAGLWQELDQVVHIGELSEALQRLLQDMHKVLSTEQSVVQDLTVPQCHP